jgi:uncharacterized protein YbdZ (MbtH family)
MRQGNNYGDIAMSITSLLEEFGEWVHKSMHYVTSADKAYHWLREQGLDVTRDIVRDVWREVGLREQWETVINTWGNDKPIPKQWIVQRESVESESLLQYIKAQWYNPETNEWREVVHSRPIDRVIAFYDYLDEVYDEEVGYAELEGYKLITIWNGGVVKYTPKR